MELRQEVASGIRGLRVLGRALECVPGTVDQKAHSGADREAKGAKKERHGCDADGDRGCRNVYAFEPRACDRKNHVHFGKNEPCKCEFFDERVMLGFHVLHFHRFWQIVER